MLKTRTELTRHSLSGPTMGTRWSAQFHAPDTVDPVVIEAALAACVAVVDQQMSTWKPDSDLMRLNRAPVGQWVAVPPELMTVLKRALEIGRLSDGAFEIAMGDAVTAWGFGAQEHDTEAMRRALNQPRPRAHEVLELDHAARRARKSAAVTLDLSGIAKGFGVDQMIAVLARFGIEHALVGLDGELRAIGQRPEGAPWTVALEKPDYEVRAPLSMLELKDSAVATSGDYRHWVDLGTQRLSHTMDPARGGPVLGAAASVTVLADTCMDADAWATAFMVMGKDRASLLARDQGLSAIFVERDGDTLRQTYIGQGARGGWQSAGIGVIWPHHAKPLPRLP
ncbi:MAG: FAD:protein FMN transferase [Roseovarius sp.]|nr:FAD:protein FMN transferase [Roseovarius sp.]